uniref:Pectinesterase inhibitor domain-containing protein n=1 Tax=Oryza punctata TaxID=4537 RepID=A0A0E0MJ85_ORYPU
MARLTMASSNGVVNAIFLFAVILVVASQAQLAANTNSFISGACKTITDASGGVISVTFCMDALGFDGRSQTLAVTVTSQSSPLSS